ncbi:hypothetical protein MDAP_002411 [Mitosporidium daphniae]
MTTASRPTWCPAKGDELDINAAPSLYYSAKDQIAHKKLKIRQPGQSSVEEIEKKRIKFDKATEEKLKLLASLSQRFDEDGDADEHVSEHGIGTSGVQPDTHDGLENEPENESQNQNTNVGLDEPEHGGSFEQEQNSDDQEEDDTELLLLELEKIKRERMEERKKLEDTEDSVIMGSNPLRFQNQKKAAAVVPWTEDTVFRNQGTGEFKPQKRFINDMGRSDFHHPQTADIQI